MKNSARNSLIVITVIFAVFVCGLFIGRHSAAAIPLANVSGLAITQPRETQAENDNEVVDRKININTASAETLALLPGIGEAMSQRIVDYRDKNGPFAHIDELKNIDGFGEKRLNNLSKYITVGE